MIGLFVILTALVAVPLSWLPLGGAAASHPMKSASDLRTFGWAMVWQALLIADCVVLGYLAAKW